MPAHPGVSDLNAAESLAIQIFSLLAEEPGRLARFLALTGIDPADVRQAAGEPAFLAAVLEHVAAEPGLIEAYAARAQCRPADVERARRLLSGGDWERDTA